jgi:uncharacterized membrane protein
MTKLEHSVDIAVPVRVAYDQWTQFEKYPEFMQHVESIEQIDDSHLLWRIEVAGKSKVFEARIVEQTPDKRIAWHSTSGAQHSGVVTFHRLGDDKCRVMLQLEFEPEGLLETVGAIVGVPRFDMAKDMQRFATYIEAKKVASGGWRGTILNKDDALAAAAAKAPIAKAAPEAPGTSATGSL